MSRLGVRLVLAANRFLPKPALPNPLHTAEMVRWQYETSTPLLELWNRAGGADRGRVLDLGSGRGGKSRRLMEAGEGRFRVISLDLSLDHLRNAAGHFRTEGWDPPGMVAGDASALPFSGDSFERIVCTDLLEHLEHPRTMLREVHRCLRPDGRLILVFNPWGSPRGSHLGNLIRLPWCQHIFSPDTLEEATRKAALDLAAGIEDREEAKRVEAWGKDLATFFHNHVHPTRITDFRRWIRKEGLFRLVEEGHWGPRPIGRRGWLRFSGIEEWLTASYGAVLSPRKPGS